MNITIHKGGEGSGNHGHSGRPGLVGGSGSEGKQKVLEDFLRNINRISVYSKESVVLKNGESYKPQPIPKGIKKGPNKECFRNAYKLSDVRDDLTYVEGYAMPDFIDLPMEHAWCVDKEGNVIDNTWEKPGSAYFGIPFDHDFVNNVILETGTFGVIDARSPTFVEKYWPEIKRRKEHNMKLTFVLKGGEGSGNFNHEGRPGEVGGSSTDGGISDADRRHIIDVVQSKPSRAGKPKYEQPSDKAFNVADMDPDERTKLATLANEMLDLDLGKQKDKDRATEIAKILNAAGVDNQNKMISLITYNPGKGRKTKKEQIVKTTLHFKGGSGSGNFDSYKTKGN